MIYLPPMQIAQGEPWAYDATVVGQDWTGYTGTATFKARPQAKWRMVNGEPVQEPILSAAVTADAAGLIQIGLSATETATFPALPRVGYFHRAVCEVAMTNATTGDVQRFQARVSVASAL